MMIPASTMDQVVGDAEARLAAVTKAKDDEIARLRRDRKRLVEALRSADAWMTPDGCDCGTDEPGTCALCMTRALLAEMEKGK